MLTVYTAAGAIPLEIDDYYIKELASGLDELVFSISIWNPHYQAIQEETNIKAPGIICPITDESFA